MSSWQECNAHQSGSWPSLLLSVTPKGLPTSHTQIYSALPKHGWIQLLRKLITFLRWLWPSEVYLFIAVIMALFLTPGIFPSIFWCFQYFPLIYAISFSWSSPRAALLTWAPDRLGIISGTCQWLADVMSGPLSKQLFERIPLERNLWPV